MPRRFFGLLAIFSVALACSHDDTASAHTRTGPRSADDGVAPRPSAITPSNQPYRVVPVSASGTITGTVDLEGAAPVLPVLRPTSDQNVCGNSVTENRLPLAGTRVGGAVVWLTDIRSGKGFPLERRVELTNYNCVLDPYVQVMSTNATLNVSNDDRTVHTNRFINVGTGQFVGIAPFNDDGEVVPVDRLKEPAEIEVVCEEHPWTHAWIAVLDHPYYAQTSTSGSFTIEGIPPGRYHVRAWQPSLGFADDSVTVTAGQQTSVAIRIRPSAANASAIPTQVVPESVRPATNRSPVPLQLSPSPASSSTPPNIPPPR
ncbi:MAG: carboxypeptidase regulatory-like domain-containing protein [Gemmatimonadaceae bacterium]